MEKQAGDLLALLGQGKQEQHAIELGTIDGNGHLKLDNFKVPVDEYFLADHLILYPDDRVMCVTLSGGDDFCVFARVSKNHQLVTLAGGQKAVARVGDEVTLNQTQLTTSVAGDGHSHTIDISNLTGQITTGSSEVKL